MPDLPIPEVVELHLPSRLELLSVLDRLSYAICERLEFDEDTATQVTMAVIEAGTNAVQHGHQRDPRQTVRVRFLLHPDRLEVHVHDHGKGFDASSVRSDITSPEHLLDMRGRGIFILRSCCDRVECDSGPGGTVCRLVKQRPASTRRAAES